MMIRLSVMCGNRVFARFAREGVAMQALLSQSDRRVAGLRQVLRAVEAGRAQCVFLAADAPPKLLAQARQAAQRADVPVEMADSMDKLGHMCRIAVPCAAAAVVGREGE